MKVINGRFVVALVLVCSAVPVIAQDDVASQRGGAVSICLLGHWDEYSGLYSDVWGDGDYAYLPNWGSDGNTGRVHIINISNPSNPTLASTFFVPAPNQNASPQDVKVHNGLLFISLEGDANDGVAIVDVRDPTNPTQIVTIRIPGNETVHNTFYESGYLYIPEGNAVFIVDLTTLDPDNPPASPITTPKWTLTGVGTQFVHDITVKGGRLYAAGWGSMEIYDVTNIATTPPTLIGSVGGNSLHSMWPSDDGLFVVTGEERGGGGVHVYRMTENAGSLTLTLTDQLSLSGAFSVHNQIVLGNRLYNSWYERGLQIFDIDPNTGQLQFVGSFDTQGSGLGNWGVFPQPGTGNILLSDTDEGLFIVSESCVCTPSAPPVAETIRDTVSIKNRFLTFTGSEPGRFQAARVTFVDLPAPYDLWNGNSLWVGAPSLVSQGGSSIAPNPPFLNFKASTLSCGDPVFLDWNALGMVDVFHEGIVPGGTYHIQLIDSSCPIGAGEGNFSAPLVLATAEWGDTVADLSERPSTPPDGENAISDALAVLERFSGVSSSIVKARADLEPRCLDLLINVADVLSSLAGFQGLSYPFVASAADPCDSTCGNPLP